MEVKGEIALFWLRVVLYVGNVLYMHVDVWADSLQANESIPNYIVTTASTKCLFIL